MIVTPHFQPVMQAKEYNSNSKMQAEAIEYNLPNLRDALQTVPMPSNGCFTVAEFGVSQGRNSVTPMRLVLSELNRRVAAELGAGSKLDVMIVHEDLPQNDFSSLFEIIEDADDSYLVPKKVGTPSKSSRPIRDEVSSFVSPPASPSPSASRSAFADEPSAPAKEEHICPVTGNTRISSEEAGMGAYPFLNVFPLVAGRSFYKRILPKSSVQISFAFCCLHFLSKKPLETPDVSFFNHLTKDPKTYAIFDAQSRSDFNRFFELRHRELVPGGALILHVPVHNHNEALKGELSPATLVSKDVLSKVVSDMIAEGLMTEEEPRALSSCEFIPNYVSFRALIGELAESRRFEVKSIDVKEIPDRPLEQLHKGEISLEKYAEIQVGVWKAVFWPSYQAGLMKYGRTEEEATRILNDLFGRCTKIIPALGANATALGIIKMAYAYLTKI